METTGVIFSVFDVTQSRI